jgi:hypothetical protein
MPVFKYQAKDDKGNNKGGELEAFDEKDAIGKLHEQNLIIISLECIKQKENTEKAANIFTKKIVLIFISLFFGFFCLAGGFLFSGFLVKKNQSIGEAKKREYEKKFLEISYDIITNTYMSELILEGTSKVWRSAIEIGVDFNGQIQGYLAGMKSSLKIMEDNNNKIEVGMQDLKDYPIQYQEAYNTLMELYEVYSQIYALARAPSGSLMSFNNKVNDLTSEFTKITSRLKIYMPNLNLKQ